MKKIILIILTTFILLSCTKNGYKQKINTNMPNIYIRNGNSGKTTYFDVHDIYGAWSYSKGANIKVGIIDHSFDEQNNPKLYTQVKKFYKSNYIKNSGHGFWMASTLQEIAPKVEIFGLDINFAQKNEDETVELLIKAIEWAIENDLKILTYSNRRISKENRVRLDLIIDKASENGTIIIFLHNSNKNNFLVSKIEPPIDGINNDAMFNIYDKDYSLVLGHLIDSDGKVESDMVYKSVSSKAPVLAGIIAMMLDVNTNLNAQEIKKILINTTYIFENYDTRIEKTVNAKHAIEKCLEMKE